MGLADGRAGGLLMWCLWPHAEGTNHGPSTPLPGAWREEAKVLSWS